MIQWLKCVFNKHESESVALEFGLEKNGLQIIRVVDICKHCGSLYVLKEKRKG